VESLNGIPFTGRAVAQGARWYAHPGDTLRLGIRRPDGSRATVAIPLRGYTDDVHLGEAVFIVVLQIVLPLLCLITGYGVALARPTDPNAWFILVLLSYPEACISVSTFNWWPGPWLVLRLGWHVTLEIVTPAAMLWFGLLFTGRSRIDVRFPWLKWLVLIILAGALAVALLDEYGAWYDWRFLPGGVVLDAIADQVVNWLTLVCIVLYWLARNMRSTHCMPKCSCLSRDATG